MNYYSKSVLFCVLCCVEVKLVIFSRKTQETKGAATSEVATRSARTREDNYYDEEALKLVVVVIWSLLILWC
jgi:hypothetical protein